MSLSDNLVPEGVGTDQFFFSLPLSHTNTEGHMNFVLASLLPTGLVMMGTPPPPPSSWTKEAEKKHARVAMLAFPTLAVLSSVTGSDPVVWLNHQPVETQIMAYSLAGTLESVNLSRLGKGFSLKDGEAPGKLVPWDVNPDLDTAEDIVGRVAMLATVPYFVNSLLMQ